MAVSSEGLEFFAERFRRHESACPDAMEALWAELPASRAANPDMWDQAMNFWKENFLLSAQFGSKSKLLVNIPLLKALTWQQVRWDQQDLLRVLNELLMEQPTRIKHSTAFDGRGLVYSVASWMGNTVWGLVGWSSDLLDNDNELVVVQELERTSREILSRRRANNVSGDISDLLVLRSVLLKEEHISPYDLDLVVRWLQRNGLCATAPFGDEDMIIKFAPDKSSSPRPYITERDLDMMKLLHAITALDEDLSKLAAEIDKDKETVQKHLAVGQRTQAMTCLKRKKKREQQLEKREAMRDNLMHIILETQNAVTHQQVVDAFRTGASLLKSAQPNVEDVHETMDEVAEALESHQEIEAALQKGVGGVIEENESDLLAELEELVREEQEMEVLSALAHAPSVPASTGMRIPEAHVKRHVTLQQAEDVMAS